MELILTDSQKTQHDEILEIWEEYKIAISTSVMGSGKTYVACKLAEGFDILIVFCPSLVKCVWSKMAETYGINMEIISYDCLTSIKGKTPKHGYLVRTDTENGIIIYTPTQKFKDLIKNNKCCIVADEFHNMKNKNSRFYAFNAITREINKTDCESKILMLSGTPYDKKEHVINTLQLCCLTNSTEIYNYNLASQILNVDGLNEILSNVIKFDKNKVENIIDKYPIVQKNIADICYNIYINIIQQHIVTTMPAPQIDVKLKCYNFYMSMNEKDSIELKKSITMLKNLNKKLVSIDEETEKNAITTALLLGQNAKINNCARLTKFILNSCETNKVVVFLDYDDPIYKLYNLLENYGPVIINGKTPKENRNILIQQFQENNTDLRLIIFNMSMGCEGINLHDVHGGFNRYAIACPNHHIMKMHQMTMRFYRIGAKTDATVYNIYGLKDDEEETSIIHCLAKKTKIMEETLPQQVKDGTLFPGDYIRLIETSNGSRNVEHRIENPKHISIEETQTYSMKKITCRPNIKETVFKRNTINTLF